MKKTFASKIMVWMLLALLFIYPSIAHSTGDALVLENITVTPQIYPGDRFNISFNIRNAWYGDARDVYVHLEGDYPLLEKSPTDPIKVGNLGFLWWSKPVGASFELSVDESASAGTYSVDAVLSYTRYSDAVGRAGGYERYTQVVPILITVKGTAVLDVYVKTSNPEKIRAGDTAELKLVVTNLGSDIARNVLLFSQSIEGMDVLWFSKGAYVGDILPQDSKSSSITIEVDDNAKAGEYLLPVKLSYEDMDGARFDKIETINITVEESSDFDIEPVSNTVQSDTKDNEVLFTIQNSGSKLAEDLKVILRADYPFTPTGNEYFVGELYPNDKVEVMFHVDVDSEASTQKYPIDVFIIWKEDEDSYTKVKTTYINTVRSEAHEIVYVLAVIAIPVLIAVLRKIKMRKSG